MRKIVFIYRFISIFALTLLLTHCQSVPGLGEIIGPRALQTSRSKIYLQNIQPADTSLDELSQRANNGLLLRLTTRSDGRYIIMTDDSLKSILSQLSLQSAGLGSGDETARMHQIGNLADFDILVGGELKRDGNYYLLTIREMKLSRDRIHFDTVMSEAIRFHPYQMDYYLNEVVKKINNPAYVIRKNRAPSLSDTEIMVTAIQVRFAEIKDVSSYHFQFEDHSIDSLAQALQRYVSEADQFFAAADYEESSDLYNKILDSIYALTPKQQASLQNLLDDVKTRFKAATARIYMGRLTEIDAELNATEHASLETLQDFIDDYSAVCSDYQDPHKNPPWSWDAAIISACENRNIELRLAQVRIQEGLADAQYDGLEFGAAIAAYTNLHAELVKVNAMATGKNLKRIDDYLQRISGKIVAAEESGRSYTAIQAGGLIEIAEVENARSILERNMGKSRKSQRHKFAAMNAMDQAAAILIKNRVFASKEVIQNYRAVAGAIEHDNDGQLRFSLANILLAPLRYIANVGKAIADIFMFRVGIGVGAGAEVGPFGAGLGIGGLYPMDISTVYSKNYRSPVSRAWNIALGRKEKTQNANEDEGVYLFGIVYPERNFPVPIAQSNCLSVIAIRFCGSGLSYTNINVWAGALVALQINIETHRIIEFLGVLFFQDWHLLDERNRRFQYFGYGELQEIP